ncbi:HNH endonuclease [Flavobacterium sp. LC2016-12]|uniref:HNH endonuclease n=1 Tax=Flavobacterium sp. LC2016-12 TaxID=2783794 RepID=UPI00188B455A|nr:HNH endonuclease [Flavobacterium sp. LC2016-12]MBF4466222.1 HNH endonuclease [Flavobacterium sp. LC2016-12]
MYKSSDIKWIKSVTRDKGNSWAYMEYKLGDTFNLNFSKNPKWYPTNYEKAKPGELMVIFQTLKSTPTFGGGTFITHLVTPLDNLIGKVSNPDHPYIRLVGVVGIPKVNLPLDSTWTLFKANRGQICFVDTLESHRGDKTILQKQNFLFELFNIDNNLITEIYDEKDNDEGLEEGADKSVYKLHKFKERKPELIAKAKAIAKEEDRLFCEACGFNFETEYPLLGLGFIECHHRVPISIGGIRKTKFEDLALVCSNCHRMLHRKYVNGNYLLVEELRKLILENRATSDNIRLS